MMRLVVVSHKLCWPDAASPSGYVTDGGFPLQMEAISELFDATLLTVPCESVGPATGGNSPLIGRNLSVNPLSVPNGKGVRRKIDMLRWLFVNGPAIWRAVKNADAVHTPIPGDVGTIGMLFALVLRKPLFVRHCGNWLAPRTTAEHLWKWTMERFAGGRNVMFATGGSAEPPSTRNPGVRWIFSTSLRARQIAEAAPPEPPSGGDLRLVIACRQEELKGTDVVIDALPLIARKFAGVRLEVIGGGSLLGSLRARAEKLGVGDRVDFRGKVEQSEVLRLIRGSHLFCYPTAASEGFPKVVLEALASGLPVITTRVSVLPKLLGSDCGVLLSERTPRALTDAIDEICADPDVFRRKSANAIATARDFSLERWRDEIGAALRDSWNIDHLSPANKPIAAVREDA